MRIAPFRIEILNTFISVNLLIRYSFSFILMSLDHVITAIHSFHFPLDKLLMLYA